jgi:hypothetical protein
MFARRKVQGDKPIRGIADAGFCHEFRRLPENAKRVCNGARRTRIGLEKRKVIK